MVEILKADVRAFHWLFSGSLQAKPFDNAVDYNSWQESDKGRRLAASLDKDAVLVEGIPKASSKPARYTMTDSEQATRNSTRVENISPRWVIGGITRTLRSPSMVSAG